MLQPSASKTELLLICPRPFYAQTETLPDDPSEPALYGSTFHVILAECLRSPMKTPLEKQPGRFAKVVDRVTRHFDMKDARQEVAAHVKSSVKVLRNWLSREKLEIIAVEKPFAISAQSDGNYTSRAIEPHDANHIYDVHARELPGTVDVIAANRAHNRVVVIDHKTGVFEDWFANDETVRFAMPASVPQMRTLGLVAQEPPGRPCLDVEVAIFHADRRGLPIVYVDPYDFRARTSHAFELHSAFQRLSDPGLMRPGEYCKRCPARIGCPARAAHLLVESSAQLVATANQLAVEPIDPKALYALPTTDELAPGELEKRAGALYDLIKRFSELAESGRAELRRLVKAGHAIETREGKTLSIREQTYETLSKKSVIEALGKVKGERELEKMRKKGLIREATREMLIAEK